MTVKVSVIITAHNYGKFLPEALDSVVNQNYNDFEIIVVNDGSTDNTKEVLSHYQEYNHLAVITLEGVGLASACNLGIKQSVGSYIIRLDADDYFDENILLVESVYLDNNPNIGMVFCDYHTVDIHSDIIDTIRRAKLNDEVELLDRPALAAGAMYRRKCYDSIDGYNEKIRYQEDYDFWIKFIEKFQIRNVSLPLMYYRQHGKNMSRNWDSRMHVRRSIKREFVRTNRAPLGEKVIAIVPARHENMGGECLQLMPFCDSNLLTTCINKLKSIDLISKVVVSTDDQNIADIALSLDVDVPYIRPKSMSSRSVSFEEVLFDLLHYFYNEEDQQMEIAVILNPHSPFIQRDHVCEAIDSMTLYDTDSVIAVVKDLSFHWTSGRHGLMPSGYKKRVLKQDKDIVYKEAGGLYVINVKSFLASQDIFGKSIGHIEMTERETLRIQSPYEYWLARKISDDGGW